MATGAHDTKASVKHYDVPRTCYIKLFKKRALDCCQTNSITIIIPIITIINVNSSRSITRITLYDFFYELPVRKSENCYVINILKTRNMYTWFLFYTPLYTRPLNYPKIVSQNIHLYSHRKGTKIKIEKIEINTLKTVYRGG